jgi:hypothetical protein
MPKRSAIPAIFLLLALAGGVACAGRAFEAARHEDTAAAYAQFLREHPGSRYAQEARERSALVRVRANPGPAAYQAFLERYPESPLVPELRALVEEAFFRRARATGSVEAYQRFLEEFGDGRYAARARGNAAYLEARGFAGDPEALARFAAEHPESDFAAEAKRSAQALQARSGSAFRQVGLKIGIAAGTPGADRLARVFTERAREAYSAAGLRLVPASDDGPDVRLLIEHKEERLRTQLDGTELTSPGIRATTRVRLERADDEQPIWSQEFRFQTVAAVREDDSILFGPGAQSYWSSFFVPAVSWSSQTAARSPHRLEKPVVAVDATATHAFTLFADGDFRVFEIGDPEQPMLVAEYRRERDLTGWSGLRVVGDRVLIFGEDGIEVVSLGGGNGPTRVAAWGRGEVGSIQDVEPVRGGLVVAGKRGLLFVPGGSGAPEGKAAPQVLLDRPVPGMARLGDRLVFTDGSSLYVSTLPLLRQQRVEGELRLGTGFGPERVRVRGHTALVWGERGLVQVSLARPSAPALLSRVEATEVGAVHDALLVRGRLFLLGDRGLQLADPRGEHVVDAVEVAAAARLDASGRHLVMVGEQSIQVVDTTPLLLAGTSPASLEAED